MSDLILTGASRGIGRALALQLATAGHRLVLVARDQRRLESLAEAVRGKGGSALVVPGDLSSLSAARALGERLADVVVEGGATLVHNAGLWPWRRELTADGLEVAFAVNHLGPLAMQAPLIGAGRLRRVLVVSAGLIFKGRFDPARTPTGGDFSGIRTYCTTKLCFASAMRDVAAEHPELDVLVLHPGVVQTDLGGRPGLIGWVLSRVKRGWESPEACAERLARILARERWSPAGEARWWVLEAETPWPANAEDPRVREAIRTTTARLLGTSAAAAR